MAQAIVGKTPGKNLCNVEFNHLCPEPAGRNSHMEESQGALRPDHVHREFPTQQSQAAPQYLTSSGQIKAPAPLRCTCAQESLCFEYFSLPFQDLL